MKIALIIAIVVAFLWGALALLTKLVCKKTRSAALR